MRRATFHRFNKFAMIRLHFPTRGYALNTRSAQHFAEAPPLETLQDFAGKQFVRERKGGRIYYRRREN